MTRGNARRLESWALAAVLLLAAGRRVHAAFADLGAGARAPGMGGAVTAVSADAYSIYYNPAGLALMDRPELALSYSKLFVGLTDNSDLNTSFVAYAHPLGEDWGTLGAAWNQFALSGYYMESTYYLSYARLLAKDLGPGNLYGGGSLKYLQHSFNSGAAAQNTIQSGGTSTIDLPPGSVLSGRNSVGAADADLGLLYRFQQNYSAGASLRHALQPNVAFNAGDKDIVPAEFNLGLGYTSLLSVLDVDYQLMRSPVRGEDHTVELGAERWFPRLFVGDFAVRGSLGIGTRQYKDVTAGVSYRTRRFQVDYSFDMPLGTITSTAGSHRVGLSFRFGALNAPDESVEMILDAMRKLKEGSVPEFQAEGRGLSPGSKADLDEQVALGKSFELHAKYQQAVDCLSRAADLSPSDSDLAAHFSKLNFITQSYKELPQYKSDPSQAALHESFMAYLAGKDAAAMEKASYALSLDPKNQRLAAFLSRLELATGLARASVATVSPARYKLEQNLTEAASSIADGLYGRAIELSQKVIDQDPQNADAWENVATARFALRDYESSLNAWQKAANIEKTAARRAMVARYIQSLKNVLSRQQPASAQPAFLTTTAQPSSSVIQKLYYEGVDYYTNGQLEQARKAFETILEKEPDNAPAAKALKRVEEEMAPK